MENDKIVVDSADSQKVYFPFFNDLPKPRLFKETR